MPQNGPKTARFGPFRAVRGHELLPNIETFIPTVFPASCCGALRSKTPIKMGISGYFWVFLDILKCGINEYAINPPPRSGLGKHSGVPAPGGRPPPPPKMLTYGNAYHNTSTLTHWPWPKPLS